MQDNSFFRRKLAHRLRVCAARGRARVGQQSKVDLDRAALLDEIAFEAELLPQALVDEVSRRCTEPTFARRFERVWLSLSDVLGTSLLPASAVDLVRWMIVQAETDLKPMIPSGPGCSKERNLQGRRANSRSPPKRENSLVAIADNFTGAYAVVAPMLAIWEVSTAFAQWRDKAFAASHPEASATVVSVSEGGTGRGTAPRVEILAFLPPGGAAVCRASVNIGYRQPDAVGDAITVVPRSADCQAPLVPATIGDPWGSLLAALVAVVTGLASFKVWSWLQRRRTRPRSKVLLHRMTLRAAR